MKLDTLRFVSSNHISFGFFSVVRSTGSFKMAFTRNVAKVIDMNPEPVTFA